MAGNVKDITESTFKTDVLESTQLVLVDFWAPWCGPCRAIAPVIEELANEYAGKMTAVKINVDDNPGVAAQFGVQTIPTLLLVKSGQPVDRLLGAVTKQTVKDAVDQYL